MKRLLYLVLIWSNVVMGQEKGVKFVIGSNWKAIQAAAKSSGMYIFLDCNATWCGPCREMDREIFPLPEVGHFINKNFISVKVQMDSSARDNDAVKSWYADAHAIKEAYKVTAFPTYLFFSPDGRIVHRSTGFKSAGDLIAVAESALDPHKQYHTLLDNYLCGVRDTSTMKQLAKYAASFGEQETAGRVAKAYIEGLDERELYTRDNIDFISQFTRSSRDRGFRLLYHHSAEINKVMDDNAYAEIRVGNVIILENKAIQAAFKPGAVTPDWDAIYADIKKKYTKEYAERVVTWEKVVFYKYTKRWQEYCESLVPYVEKYGSGIGEFYLNNYSWDIFQYSTNPKILEVAISWSEQTLRKEPTNAANMDTYANLLHKVGKTNEAIQWEEKAISLEPGTKEFQITLNKMKKGEKTWN